MAAQFITDIGDAARRQYIDAESTFLAYEEAAGRARETRGGMYWKQAANGRQYLIRTNPGNGQKSLGLRSPETEDMFARFSARKVEIETRRKSLGQALVVQQRLNRALRVGRVPALVVALLNAMDKAAVSAHFTVVGTHALYAYEAAAGVRLAGAALTAQDADFLFDTRKRMRLATQLRRIDSSIISILRTVDTSFRIKDDEKFSAVNDSGFAVDFLRREVEEDDPHPLKRSDAEDEFWVVPARHANRLLNAARFSAMVVAPNGHMARMNTVVPASFAKFKYWLAGHESRDAVKRSRDRLHAEIVEQLVAEYLPQHGLGGLSAVGN